MSLRLRIYGAVVASWMALPAVLLLQDVRLALAVVGSLMCLAWFMVHGARCPHCGESVYRRRLRLFGETWTYWHSWPQRICSSCNREILGPPLPSGSEGERSVPRVSLIDSSPRKHAIRFAAMAAASFVGTWIAYTDGMVVMFRVGAGVTALWFSLSVYFSLRAQRSARAHEAK